MSDIEAKTTHVAFEYETMSVGSRSFKYETSERAKRAPSASQTWDVKIVGTREV